MGCINKRPIIRVKSIRSFKKEVKKDIKQNESKDDHADKEFSFSDFTFEETENSNSAQSQILIDAQIENNELIFLWINLLNFELFFGVLFELKKSGNIKCK